MSREKQKRKIYSLLCKLDGVGDPNSYNRLNIDQIEKYESSLFRLIDDCMPPYLYRYRPFDNREYDNFCNGRIYLNIPENYNDPTDSVAFVDAIGVSMQVLSLLAKDEAEDKGNGVFDYFESEEDMAKMLRISNDAIDTIFSIRRRTKVVCFSEVITSSLMWSHYAYNHKGFALRYKMDTIRIKECVDCEKGHFCHRRGFSFFPAIYKEKRCDVSLYALARAIHKEIDEKNADDIPVPLPPLLQKSEAWAYENEWRFLCLDRDRDYVCMEPDAVFLGSKMEYKHVLKIMKVAREKKIRIYKMKLDYYDQTFKLKYDDWTDWTDETVKGWFFLNNE